MTFRPKEVSMDTDIRRKLARNNNNTRTNLHQDRTKVIRDTAKTRSNRLSNAPHRWR